MENTNNPQMGGEGQSPSSNELRPKSKLAKYLIGLVILGAVGYGIYYLKTQKSNVKSQNDNSKVKNVETPTTPVATPTPITQQPIATTTPDPTADWKTYENKDYGFSFKYPRDWEYNVVSNKQVELNKIGKRLVVEGSDMYTIGLFISNGMEDSIDGLYTDLIADTPKEAQATINKSVINSYSVVIVDTYLQIQTYFLKNKISYSFVIPKVMSTSEFNESKSIYDQILSTFKFTD